MTLSRYHLVILVIVVVVGCAVAVAVRYIDDVYEKREDVVEKIRQGRSEELVEKPPPPPPTGKPPLDRPTSREAIVLAMTAPAPESRTADSRPARRRTLVIRGNGEFARLPAKGDEPGPLVTGLLDRARVDELIRSLDEPGEGSGEPEMQITVLAGGKTRTVARTQAGARELIELSGRQMNRTAVPETAILVVAPAEAGPSSPWPLHRTPPETFLQGAELHPYSDRPRYRGALLELQRKGVVFAHKDRLWKVVGLDLLPETP